MARIRTHLSRFIAALAVLGPLLALGAILPAAAAAAEGGEAAAGILGVSPEALQIDGRLLVGAVAAIGVAALALMAALLSEAVSIARNPVIGQHKRRYQKK